MSIMLILVGIAFFLIILVAGLVFGVMQWRQPIGKVVAIASGVLLASLLACVAIVMFLSISAQRGAPL